MLVCAKGAVLAARVASTIISVNSSPDFTKVKLPNSASDEFIATSFERDLKPIKLASSI